jgi:hypothetical protein
LAVNKIETRENRTQKLVRGKATRGRNLARENSELKTLAAETIQAAENKTEPKISAAKTNYRKEPAPRSSTSEAED